MSKVDGAQMLSGFSLAMKNGLWPKKGAVSTGIVNRQPLSLPEDCLPLFTVIRLTFEHSPPAVWCHLNAPRAAT